MVKVTKQNKVKQKNNMLKIRGKAGKKMLEDT